MDAFVIKGGRALRGTLRVNGSKNAALPLMAAALLTDEAVTLQGAPRLADIDNMTRLLASLGCHTTAGVDGAGSMRLQSIDESSNHARYEIVRTMRASISTLGPMLARRGEARIAMPGGCAIGQRPVDLHLRGMEALGAEISLDQGDIIARAPRRSGERRRLKGASIFMGGAFGSTVLGTANVMCAAALAEGRTTIECAACEPEVEDLAALLTAMGAQITGAGTPRIIVDGVDSLGSATHTVMPDRIEAGTFMIAPGLAGGSLTIENCPLDCLMALTTHLAEVGVHVESRALAGARTATCEVSYEPRRDGRLRPAHVTTQPHPGFPTDLQAQLLALLCLADGNSVVTEKIFPERFLHVAELSRMGARLFRQGPTVVVSGVDRLVGAPVMASDLRASACLVLAGLAAHGETTVHRVYHLDRGYERLEERLGAVGARIERVDAKDLEPAPPSAA